jgi:soluble lytic murein transglycosylase-like protein
MKLRVTARLRKKVGVQATPPPVPPALIQLVQQNLTPEQWYSKLGLAALERAHGLVPKILLHLIEKESKGDPLAESPRGARGLFQIMPAAQSGFTGNPFDPFASAQYVAKTLGTYVKQLGSYEKALAAFNWGRGNLFRKGLDKAPKETHQYLRYFREKGILPSKPTSDSWGEEDVREKGTWGEGG